MDFVFAESAKSRSILNDMILEANEIRENQQYRQQAINQAKQLQNHIEETVNIDAFLNAIWFKVENNKIG